MAAVITDIPSRRSAPGPIRLAPVLDVPGSVGRPSVRVIGAPQPVFHPRPMISARPGPAGYRLRRVMAMVLVVGLVLTAWVVLHAASGVLGVSDGSGSASPSGNPTTIDVAAGDTFWSIASRLQPEGDPRPLVDRLVASHGGATLKAGERLSVPRG